MVALGALMLTTIFAAAPPVASSEVSPSKILPPSATGGAPFKSERYPDPKECTVVIDSIGRVGYRIADAQSLTNLVLREFRNRVGREGAVYEGTLISDKKMTRMLDGSESEIRAEKMAYYEAAIGHAKRRVKMKFGKKKKKHYIELTCRDKGRRKSLDKTSVTGETFRGTLDKLEAALPIFCMQIAKKEPPKPKVAPKPKKKKKKKWTMPPRRD